MRYLLSLLLTLNLFANSDLELLTLAYNNNLKPVPDNFESLLESLDTNSNELSKEKIALGKKLFFEKDLSLGQNISCADCHSFKKGGADGRPTAIGHKDRKNPFHLNTPTVLNSGFSKNLFWNGSAKSLQDQAKGPLQATFEMSITPKLAEQRIENNQEYTQLFNNVYGSSDITFNKIVDAIAAYEKTLVTRGRYDQFLLGDFDQLTKDEKKGLKLFITKGCVGCHNGMGLGGQVLKKFPLTYHSIWGEIEPSKIQALQTKFKNIIKDTQKLKDPVTKINYLQSHLSPEELDYISEGFFDQIDKDIRLETIITISCNECHINNSLQVKKDVLKKVSFPFENQGGFLGAKNTNKYFRVPLLRNVVQTKPYFHNGSVNKLEDAVKIMAKHQSRAKITDKEIKTIVAFLKAVDGKMVDYLK